MSAPVKTKKLSKAKRKNLKKQVRSKATLFKHEGIVTTDIPSSCLFVANAGLGNGVQREEVQSICEQYGTIVKIETSPDKPYAFIQYSSTAEAVNAVQHIHGRLLRSPAEVSVAGLKFYLAYIENVPCTRKQTSINDNLPPGLILIEDFITNEEEHKLLQCVVWSDSVDPTLQKSLKHRRVQHYGYEFKYNLNNIDVNEPLERSIPAQCDDIISRIMATGHMTHRPDQLTVNEYEPGQGIPPHIDTHSACEDCIISLSLVSQVLMEFKHPDGQHIPVLLLPRSLLIMTGQSRYVWTHGITPRKSDIIPIQLATKCIDSSLHATSLADCQSTEVIHKSKNDISIQVDVTVDDRETVLASQEAGVTLLKRNKRTSFTFRTVRTSPCNCRFPKQCDSQQNLSADKNTSRSSLPSNEKEAVNLEERHVHKVYDEIANHFSDTRHTPWPRIAEFIKEQEEGSLLADIGCGNGKYLGINDKLYEIGAERSPKLSEICQQKKFNVFVGDILAVPLRSDGLDVSICIAVIHHLSTEERRLNAIKELVRIVRPGGKILIYVWALEQELHKMKSNYLKESKINQMLEKETSHIAKIQLSSQQRDNSDLIPEFKIDTTSTELQSSSDTEHLPIHINRTQFAKPDLLVPWHLREVSDEKHDAKNLSQVFHRYYHVFEEGELENLCMKLPNVKIIRHYYDKGNWCIVLEKH